MEGAAVSGKTEWKEHEGMILRGGMEVLLGRGEQKMREPSVIDRGLENSFRVSTVYQWLQLHYKASLLLNGRHMHIKWNQWRCD